MGVVLDSSVIIAAERAGKSPRQVVSELAALLGDTEATLSVVTVMELAHGIQRANSPERATARRQFLDELFVEISAEPVTASIAMRAGKIDGILQTAGSRIALGDLLIGATAPELGYSVATHNFRDFDKIPDLAAKRI